MVFSHKEDSGKLRLFVLGFIRLLLFVALFVSFSQERSLIFAFAIIGLVATFVPTIAERFFKVKIPASFEILVLFSLYGLLMFWNVKLVQMGFLGFDLLMNFGSAVILGIIGLTVLSALNNEEIIDASSAVIAFFSFCFAFSLGSLGEILEFYIDSLFGFTLQQGLADTMRDLIGLAVGSAIVSIAGYKYLREGRSGLFSFFVFNFMKRNWSVFRSKKYFEYSSKKIEELVARGEGDKLEFKSTLRKNLYTGKVDREIEHASLKTIAAYLNSSGGTLLVGIDDAGKVVGLEHDEFANHDKLKLYLNQVLRKQLGSSVLRHVRYEVYPFRDKHVLKIDCTRSPRRVFLKRDGTEFFYVRYGPSTVRLTGGDLIDYVSEHFK